MMTLSNLSSHQLRKIADIKERIEGLEAELAAITGESSVWDAQGSSGGKRVMSAAARERIAAAQRARWAKFNASKSEGGGGVSAPKKRRRMSAAGRAKIAAAARARWAKAKAAGKTSL